MPGGLLRVLRSSRRIGTGVDMISTFDLYKVGIGPSSSHTVGPMRAANIFVTRLVGGGLLDGTAGLRAEMFGSLGVTGHGH